MDKPKAEALSNRPVLSNTVGFATATSSALLANVLTALTVSPSLAGTSQIPSLAAAAVTLILVIHYWTVCGDGDHPQDSLERQRYNRLRTNLRSGGGGIGVVYEEGLRRALDWVDWAVGDEGRRSNSIFGRLLGLKTSAPLWTAESFDRCLVFALIYPITMVVIVWAWKGHVGPAEEALRLPRDLGPPFRAAVFLGFVIMLWSWIQFMRQSRYQNHLAWFLAVMLGLSIIFGGAGAGWRTFTFAFALSLAFGVAVAIVVNRSGINAIRGAGAGGLAFAATSAVLIALGGSHFRSLGTDLGFGACIGVAVFIAFPVAVAIAVILTRGARTGFVGLYMLMLSLAAFIGSVAFPAWFASLPSWRSAGAIILFLVLLTIINAPFDWVALGVTRALLRRGLERGRWWPFWYGLVDLLVSIGLVIALAVVTLLCVEFFERLTILSGGVPIVRVEEVLSALTTRSAWDAPEYWWIYVMLFSTMLPSVFNVSLGALSLTRGVPFLNKWLGSKMPRGRGVIISERWIVAPVLAFQTILSVGVGVAVMVAIFVAVLVVEIPFVGGGLASLAESVESAHWSQWFFTISS